MTTSYADVVSSKHIRRLQTSNGSKNSVPDLKSKHFECSSESTWDSFLVAPAARYSLSAASSPSSGYCTPTSTISQGPASGLSSPSPGCGSPQLCDDYGSKMFVYDDWDTLLRAHFLIACASPVVKRHTFRYPYPVYETAEHCVFPLGGNMDVRCVTMAVPPPRGPTSTCCRNTLSSSGYRDVVF